MSLEEAEPIPDISWAIRVLQPPPEQENLEYGELGRGRGTPPKFTSTQHLWSPSLPLGVLYASCACSRGVVVRVCECLLWVSGLGITKPNALW